MKSPRYYREEKLTTVLSYNHLYLDPPRSSNLLRQVRLSPTVVHVVVLSTISYFSLLFVSVPGDLKLTVSFLKTLPLFLTLSLFSKCGYSQTLLSRLGNRDHLTCITTSSLCL